MKTRPSILAVMAAGTLLFTGPAGGSLRAGNAESTLPQPVTREHFEAVLEHSPFNRSLNLSDSLVLSGVAELNGKQVVTVIDTVDGRTMAISEIPNLQGWKLHTRGGFAGKYLSTVPVEPDHDASATFEVELPVESFLREKEAFPSSPLELELADFWALTITENVGLEIIEVELLK